MATKTFLVGLTIIIRHLCAYYNKYDTQITQHIDGSVLTDTQKTNVKAFLGLVQGVCIIMEGLTGY